MATLFRVQIRRKGNKRWEDLMYNHRTKTGAEHRAKSARVMNPYDTDRRPTQTKIRRLSAKEYEHFLAIERKYRGR